MFQQPRLCINIHNNYLLHEFLIKNYVYYHLLI